MSELAKLIGSMDNPKIYSKLKPGLRQVISQAARKALRLERALTVRSQYANDLMQAEYEEEYVQEVLEPTIFVTEVHLCEDKGFETTTTTRGEIRGGQMTKALIAGWPVNEEIWLIG